MDAQESSAVATLSAMGFTFDGEAWVSPVIRFGRPYKDVDLAFAAKLYANGEPVASIAYRVGLNRNELSRRLRNAGLMKTRRPATKPNVIKTDDAPRPATGNHS